MLRISALSVVILSFPLFAAAEDHVIFGDSLSDEGRVFELTGQQFPPSPFYEGRFSNGPLWTEHLQGTRVNYAYSGAKTDYDNMLVYKLGSIVDNTGLQAQVDEFLASGPTVQDLAKTRFYINIGANDFLDLFNSTDPEILNLIPKAVDNIIRAANRLRDAGAEDITVMGLPNLAKIPMAKDMSLHQKQFMALIALKFSKTLENQAGREGLSFYDVEKLTAKIMHNAPDYGITNIKDACFDEVSNIVCPNPENYFFWDDKHPTEVVHRVFGEDLETE